jgi:hypothetical protein
MRKRLAALVLLGLLALSCREYRGQYRRLNELPRSIWLLEGRQDRPCSTPNVRREVTLFGPVASKDEVLVYAYRAYDDRDTGEETYDDEHLIAFEATGDLARTRDGLWREYARVPTHEAEEKIESARSQ